MSVIRFYHLLEPDSQTDYAVELLVIEFIVTRTLDEDVLFVDAVGVQCRLCEEVEGNVIQLPLLVDFQADVCYGELLIAVDRALPWRHSYYCA